MKSGQDISLVFKIEDIKCPITKEIFFDPVVAQPCGHTFEREMLEEWLKNQSACPCCAHKDITMGHPPLVWKNALFDAIKNSPDLLAQQYLSENLIKNLIVNNKDDEHLERLLMAKQLKEFNLVAAEAYLDRALVKQENIDPSNAEERNKVIVDYDQAIQLDPTYEYVYYLRGRLRGDSKSPEDWNKAIADFTKVIELDSKYIDAYYDRALLLSNTNRNLEGAIADYDKVIELWEADENTNAPNVWEVCSAWSLSDIYIFRAELKEEQNKLDDDIADYDNAIELDPTLEEANQEREEAKEQKRSTSLINHAMFPPKQEPDKDEENHPAKRPKTESEVSANRSQPDDPSPFF